MVGKKGNTKLSEITKTEKTTKFEYSLTPHPTQYRSFRRREKTTEKWTAENWATGKLGNEK